MSTLNQLIESARSALSGFDTSKDSVGSLTTALSPTDIAVATDAADVSTGIAEIDLELVRIKAADSTSGALQLYPGFGRGYRGTTPAPHIEGAEVTINPTWPRYTIASEINAVLSAIYPRIYVVAETTVAVDNYGRLVVPTNATGILSVFAKNPIDNQWNRPNRWQYDPHAADGDGRTLQVNDWLTGSEYRLVYAKRPGRFDLSGSVNQDFATVTGLDERIESIINLGLAARLAPFFDVSRIPHLAAEARLEANSLRDNTTLLRMLDSLFARAVNAESAELNRAHPIKAHRTVI